MLASVEMVIAENMKYINQGKKRGRIEGRREGKIEGKSQGKREAVLEIAKAMIKEKFTMSQISKVTKLSEDELLKLK